MMGLCEFEDSDLNGLSAGQYDLAYLGVIEFVKVDLVMTMLSHEDL